MKKSYTDLLIVQPSKSALSFLFFACNFFSALSSNYTSLHDSENGTISVSVPIITPDGPTSFCEGESVVLTSSSATDNVWSPNGETTQSIIVTTSGSYFVTVGNTEVSSAVEVTVNANPETPVITASGPLEFCEGDSVILSSTQAEGYLWNPSGEATQSITVYASGFYSLTTYNVNGCRGNSDTVEVVVNTNPAPVISANGPTSFCESGNVDLTTTSFATYEWSPNGETNQTIGVSDPGDYQVLVTDVNGCSATSLSIHIEVFDLPAVTINANGSTNFCEGDSVTLVTTSPGAGAYQWLRNGIPVNGANNNIITVSDFAVYSVVVTDQNGCQNNSQEIAVQVGQIPYAYAGMDETICPGDSITISAANGGQNFLWSNGATTQSIVVSPADTTPYILTVSNPFCSMEDTDTLFVNVSPLPVAAAEATGNFSTGNQILFSNNSGDSSIVISHWDFGDGSSSSIPESYHSFDTEGNHTILLTVENEYGCTNSDTLEIDIEQIFVIPNIITPNADGINDALDIPNNGADNYEINILNRYGQVLFEQKAKEIHWGGKTNSGVELSAGTYFYILTVNNSGSLGSQEQSGFITLIK